MKKIKNAFTIWLVICLFSVSFLFVSCSEDRDYISELEGYDLLAYYTILNISWEFEEPPSVRLVSGTVGFVLSNAYVAFFRLSYYENSIQKTNDYSIVYSRNSDDYSILNLQDVLALEDNTDYTINTTNEWIEKCAINDDINIFLVNNALTQIWNEIY